MKSLKVIIIGGGIGGLSCARACLDAGFGVEIYEKRSLEQMLSGPGGILIQNSALGGKDDEVGGAKQALRSLFADYAQPIPAIIESLDEAKIYRDDIME